MPSLAYPENRSFPFPFPFLIPLPSGSDCMTR